MNDKEIVDRLLEEHFYEDEGSLHYCWKEMYGLKEVDPKLNEAMLNRK